MFSSDYTPGDLSSFLSPNLAAPKDIQGPKKTTPKSPKTSNKKKNNKKEKTVAEITAEGTVSTKKKTASMRQKKRKKKKKGKRERQEAKEGGGEDGDKPVHESLTANAPSVLHARVMRAAENTDKINRAKDRAKALDKGEDVHKDDERLPRTLFVGNVHVDTTKKMLARVFKPHGKVESMRFRSVGVSDPKLSKRATVATKTFHSERQTLSVYIVFEEEAGAKAALSENGRVEADVTWRVDMAGGAKGKPSNDLTIFVGNLPFNAKDEDVRQFFSDCGEIKNVRVVRDRNTGMGKGIAYISFETKDALQMAQTYNGLEFLGRQVRVFKAKEKGKLTKKKQNTKFEKKKGHGGSKKEGGFKKAQESQGDSWKGQQAPSAHELNSKAASRRKLKKHSKRNTGKKEAMGGSKKRKQDIAEKAGQNKPKKKKGRF